MQAGQWVHGTEGHRLPGVEDDLLLGRRRETGPGPQARLKYVDLIRQWLVSHYAAALTELRSFCRR